MSSYINLDQYNNDPLERAVDCALKMDSANIILEKDADLSVSIDKALLDLSGMPLTSVGYLGDLKFYIDILKTTDETVGAATALKSITLTSSNSAGDFFEIGDPLQQINKAIKEATVAFLAGAGAGAAFYSGTYTYNAFSCIHFRYNETLERFQLYVPEWKSFYYLRIHMNSAMHRLFRGFNFKPSSVYAGYQMLRFDPEVDMDRATSLTAKLYNSASDDVNTTIKYLVSNQNYSSLASWVSIDTLLVETNLAIEATNDNAYGSSSAKSARTVLTTLTLNPADALYQRSAVSVEPNYRREIKVEANTIRNFTVSISHKSKDGAVRPLQIPHMSHINMLLAFTASSSKSVEAPSAK